MFRTILNLFHFKPAARKPSPPPRFRPTLEALEDRVLMSAAGPIESVPWTKTVSFNGHYRTTPPAAAGLEVKYLWGDGASSYAKVTSLGQNRFRATATHEYDTEGPPRQPLYVAILNKHDKIGWVQTSVPINVADAPIHAQGQSLGSIPAGNRFTGVVATFKDDSQYDKAEEFRATITWNDGSNRRSTGIIKQTGPGTFQVIGTHIFRNQPTVPVRIDIVSRYGSKAVANSPIQVTPRVKPQAIVEIWASPIHMVTDLGAVDIPAGHISVVVRDPETGNFQIFFAYPDKTGKFLTTGQTGINIKDYHTMLTGDHARVSFATNMSFDEVTELFGELGQHVNNLHRPYQMIPELPGDSRAVTSNTYVAYLVRALGASMPLMFFWAPGTGAEYVRRF